MKYCASLHLILFIIFAQHSNPQKTVLSVKKIRNAENPFISTEAQTFKELVAKSNIFIDKSLLIKEFLENPEKVIILTLPVKWGKSINIDMVKTFLEIPIDKYGRQQIPITETKNYKLFKNGEIDVEVNETEVLQRPLLISQYNNIIDEHLGKHIVLLLNFENVEGENDIEMVDAIGTVMSEAFAKHKYLLRVLKTVVHNDKESKEVRLRAKSNFKKFKDILEKNECTEDDVADSLQFLCKLLYRYYQKRIILMIQSYDRPFIHLMHSEFFQRSDVKPIVKFFGRFFSIILEENKYLEKAILSGIFRFSNIPNDEIDKFKDYNFITNPWYEFFGFSERELDLIFQHAKADPEAPKRAHLWYLGYKTGVDLNYTVCNPYSIANMLYFNDSWPFLSNQSQPDYALAALNVPTFIEIYEQLINFEKLNVTLQTRLNKAQMVYLKSLLSKNESPKFRNTTNELVLSYLTASGYLRANKLEGSSDNLTVELEIPNREMLITMSRKLMLVYYKKFGLSQSEVDKAAGNLGVFLINTQTRPPRRLLEIFEITLSKVQPIFITYEDGTHNDNAALMHAMLNFISMKLRAMYKFNTLVFKEHPITYMISNKRNISAVVSIEYSTNSLDDLLTKTMKRKTLLDRFGESSTKKFIAITVYPNRSVDLLADLVDEQYVDGFGFL